MQTSYAYWRASHPLVFISSNLLVGIIIADYLPTYTSNNAMLISFLIFVITIVFLLGILLIPIKINTLISLSTLAVLISWGVAIKLTAQQKQMIAIPYPTNFIEQCRNGLIGKINKTILNKEANSFALAILIGLKKEVAPGLISAYTQLGIIHIIAISGMHLDILFKNLARLTQLLPRKRMFILLELIILLLAAWIYTLMAFASPSIVRASLFFSIYIIGKFMGAASFMLNTIAGGILILLLFNLKDLNNIGLQLSYAAVIGIHLFYKPFYKSIEMQNPIIQFLWSNCCMSLAAQLTTFPILALHFHQIAGWVLVSNFIMIPLSTLILYGLGILLIMPMQLSITSIWGKVVEQYILLFNHLVQNWFNQTKAESISISMNAIQIVLYYVLLLFGYLWFYQKQPKWLIAILGLISLYILLKLFS